MISKLIQRNVFRLASTHSFYSVNTLECPINPTEESYQVNHKMMDQVNSQYSKILKQVITQIKQVTTQEDQKVLDKLKKAGKLPVRQRI